MSRRWLVDTRPLRASRPFRRYWLGSGLSGLGGQLALVAVLQQAWELTGSPLAVGAIALAQAAAMVACGLAGGTLADAFDRRRLVLLALLAQALLAGLLALQAFADWRSWWLLLALVTARTGAGALGAPASRTFAPRLLGPELLPAGVALTHLSFQVTLLAGPAVGGLVTAAWGPGACHAVNALTFAAAVYGVLGLPALRPEGCAGRAGARAIAHGLAYVRRRPVLVGSLSSDLLATVTAMPISLFPVVNDERFGGRPELLGLFLSAVAVGGIAAGALSGTFTRSQRPAVVMLSAAGVWGASLAFFGLASSVWLALGCLVVAGAADTVSVISRGAIVQLATEDALRGRVSALEHVIGVAGPQLGNFRGGAVAGATSASFAAVSGGVTCVLAIAALAFANGHLRRFRADRGPAGAGTAVTSTA